MAGTEVMMGVGAGIKDPLPTEKSPGDHIQTPEKRPDKSQSLDSRSSHTDDDKTTDSPSKNKTGTPKKSDVARNVFAGARPSPKKNPWTRNPPSEGGGKEGTREGGTGVGVALVGSEVTDEGKGIEIPKGEVSLLCTPLYLWRSQPCACVLNVALFNSVTLTESSYSICLIYTVYQSHDHYVIG